jgi:hypothetical protein
MNCQNFEVTISELARRQMLDAREREDALAHIEVCKPCATRFADDQALTAGLRVIATSAKLAEAPAHVERALLSAFRQGAAMPSAHDHSIAQEKTPRWLPWSLAAAATILVIFTFGLLQLLSNEMREPVHQQARTIQPAPLLSPTVGEVVGQSNTQGMNVPAAENPERRSITTGNFPPAVERRRGLMREAGMRGRQLTGRSNLGTTESANDEIATDFLPLTYGNNLSQFDDGQVVRVEVPRSLLQSFGFPVNAERVGERVKADVLLGNDGVARAIRFIR